MFDTFFVIYIHYQMIPVSNTQIFPFFLKINFSEPESVSGDSSNKYGDHVYTH